MRIRVILLLSLWLAAALWGNCGQCGQLCYGATLQGGNDRDVYASVQTRVEKKGRTFKFKGVSYAVTSEVDKTCCIVRSDTKDEVNIPVTADGYVVTAVDASAFRSNAKLKKIVLPETVSVIGEHAFDGCTALREITIPSMVKSVADFTFFQCTNLKSVRFEGNDVVAIGEYAFAGCSELREIKLPNSIVTIEAGVFSNCKNLTRISMPVSLKRVGDCAFDGCVSLERVDVPELSRWCSIAFSDAIANPLRYGKMYVSGKEVTKLEIPEDVGVVRRYAFAGYEGLKELVLHSEDVVLEGDCFAGCEKIKKVTCTAVALPSRVSEDAFDESVYDEATLCVPKGTTIEGTWSKFHKRSKL